MTPRRQKKSRRISERVQKSWQPGLDWIGYQCNSSDMAKDNLGWCLVRDGNMNGASEDTGEKYLRMEFSMQFKVEAERQGSVYNSSQDGTRPRQNHNNRGDSYHRSIFMILFTLSDVYTGTLTPCPMPCALIAFHRFSCENTHFFHCIKGATKYQMCYLKSHDKQSAI